MRTFNARYGPGGGVGETGARAYFQEWISGAERKAFTRERVVSAHAKSLNVVIQPDNQPITRRCAGHGRQPVCDGIAHHPARLSLNRRNLNIEQRLRHAALPSTRQERTETATRQATSNPAPRTEATHTTQSTKQTGTTHKL